MLTTSSYSSAATSSYSSAATSSCSGADYLLPSDAEHYLLLHSSCSGADHPYLLRCQTPPPNLILTTSSCLALTTSSNHFWYWRGHSLCPSDKRRTRSHQWVGGIGMTVKPYPLPDMEGKACPRQFKKKKAINIYTIKTR